MSLIVLKFYSEFAQISTDFNERSHYSQKIPYFALSVQISACPTLTGVQAFQVQPEGQTHGEPNLGVQVQVRKKMPRTWPRPDLGQSMDVLKQKKNNLYFLQLH